MLKTSHHNIATVPNTPRMDLTFIRSAIFAVMCLDPYHDHSSTSYLIQALVYYATFPRNTPSPQHVTLLLLHTHYTDSDDFGFIHSYLTRLSRHTIHTYVQFTSSQLAIQAKIAYITNASRRS